MIFSSKKLSWHDGPRLPAQFRAQMGELHQVDACPKPTNLVIGTNVSAGIHIIAWAGHFRPEPRSLLIGKAWCLGPGHLTRSLGKHWSSPWSSLLLGTWAPNSWNRIKTQSGLDLGHVWLALQTCNASSNNRQPISMDVDCFHLVDFLCMGHPSDSQTQVGLGVAIGCVDFLLGWEPSITW